MINVGDIVMVNKDDQSRNWIRRAQVLNVANNTGEAWGFLDLDSGTEIWTTETFTIYKEPTP